MNTGDAHGGLNAAVAATLNGERVAAGLTFDQLATRVGVSKRQLMRLLSSAERDIDVNVLAALAVAFGMKSSDVMTLAEERMRRTPPPPTPPRSPADTGSDLARAVKRNRAKRGVQEPRTGND
jgi:transcriptional regulator with XRE-family HTH domain